eukprot:6468847-Amphidinium_carterae.3
MNVLSSTYCNTLFLQKASSSSLSCDTAEQKEPHRPILSTFINLPQLPHTSSMTRASTCNLAIPSHCYGVSVCECCLMVKRHPPMHVRVLPPPASKTISNAS